MTIEKLTLITAYRSDKDTALARELSQHGCHIAILSSLSQMRLGHHWFYAYQLNTCDAGMFRSIS